MCLGNHLPHKGFDHGIYNTRRFWQEALMAITEGGRFRGAEWTLSHDAKYFIASIHITPMEWIFSWFRNDLWTELTAQWARDNSYSCPPLGDPFMIIYKRSADQIQIQRQLYPASNMDAAIIAEHHKTRTTVRRSLTELAKVSPFYSPRVVTCLAYFCSCLYQCSIL